MGAKPGIVVAINFNPEPHGDRTRLGSLKHEERSDENLSVLYPGTNLVNCLPLHLALWWTLATKVYSRALLYPLCLAVTVQSIPQPRLSPSPFSRIGQRIPG